MPRHEPEQPIDVVRTTLAGALKANSFKVPPFQREYSWKADRVKKLFDDLNNAMVKQYSNYFLGAVVLTPGIPQNVIDGQQRLATTVIFLSAVRDAFLEMGRKKDAKSIEDSFLFTYDRREGVDVPRLIMNVDDREYMRARVLARPEDRKERLTGRLESHWRIDKAAQIAADRVRKIMANSDKMTRKVAALHDWIDFLEFRAVIVTLAPPNTARAYQMFKTLNDRGQHASQADLIKSHLFEQSKDAQEAQAKWSSMRSAIEGTGTQPREESSATLTYLHHACIALNGPTKADDIFEFMEENIEGSAKALEFLEGLASYANDYVAIYTRDHPKWNSYDPKVKTCVEHISQEIKMTFLRPLMLAVASEFDPRETKVAFEMFRRWVVRFFIAGGSRSGLVEKTVGVTAHSVMMGKITKAADLESTFAGVVPNDAKFRARFIDKTIKSAKQARFFLWELECQERTDFNRPSKDTDDLNLEHILPKNPNARGWGHFTSEERKHYPYRIGNFVLVRSPDNGLIGDKPFADKRPVIEKSKYLLLTNDVIERTAMSLQWTAKDIAERQAWLADLAVKRWPRETKKK